MSFQLTHPDSELESSSRGSMERAMDPNPAGTRQVHNSDSDDSSNWVDEGPFRRRPASYFPTFAEITGFPSTLSEEEPIAIRPASSFPATFDEFIGLSSSIAPRAHDPVGPEATPSRYFDAPEFPDMAAEGPLNRCPANTFAAPPAGVSQMSLTGPLSQNPANALASRATEFASMFSRGPLMLDPHDWSSEDDIERTMKYRHLATGGQAAVYLSRRCIDGAVIVEKVFIGSRFEERVVRDDRYIYDTPIEVVQEMYRVLGESENIVKILRFPTPAKPSMHLEVCDGGDLHDLIAHYQVKIQQRFPEGFLWHVFDSLLKALVLMHTGPQRVTGGTGLTGWLLNTFSGSKWKPIVHRDMKPDNVLLARNPEDPDGYPIVKLSDFDFAAFYDEDDCTHPSHMSGWRPPEQYRAPVPRATPAGDIWAVGAIIYAMSNGHSPEYVTGQGPAHWNPPWPRTAAGASTPRILWGNYSEELETCVRIALAPVWERADAKELSERVAIGTRECWAREGKEMPGGYLWMKPLEPLGRG